MNLTIRKIEEMDYKPIFDFRSNYIDMNYQEFVIKTQKNSDLCFVVYDKDELIGYCLGEFADNKNYWVLLDEIVTNVSATKDYSRKGIGTKLIKKFEKSVWENGYKAIGLGSSDNYKVEQFYLKNNYIPTEIVAKSKGLDLERVKIADYASGKQLQKEFRMKYKLNEVIFIFEKYHKKGNRRT